MPCTYTRIKMREQEKEREVAAEQERLAEEERKKREIARKKAALIAALAAMGFGVESTNEVAGGNEFIVAGEKR